MGAHSIPQSGTVDVTVYRDVTLTLEERGYLKEMLHTYKRMFAEQMTSLKFSNTTDMQKREFFRKHQLSIGDNILEKIIESDRLETGTRPPSQGVFSSII